VQDNAQVRRFIEQFQTGSRKAVVERWLARAGRYLPMILEVFRQKGLPEELVFTAMIESGFDPVAVSRAGAKGLWQFMATTARRYGLRVDRWLDERLDPEKSTVAAANYLLDLYAVFGSWDLAKAAYNAGGGTVLRAMRGMRTNDFWELARGRILKNETRDFVPAIHAAILIAREPDRYGFAVTPEDPLRYEILEVPGSTRLSRIAGLTGIPSSELEGLNPALHLKQTPPGGPYALKVPVGRAEMVRAALEQAAARRVAAAQQPQLRAARGRGIAPALGIYVVRPRDTLGAIARRYGVSLAQIMSWNDLDQRAVIRPGDRLRVASTVSGGQEQGQGGFK
jgi:membrane-bound lytic murein transglycosylase D